MFRRAAALFLLAVLPWQTPLPTWAAESLNTERGI